MKTIVVCAAVLVAIVNGIHGQSSPEGKEQICEPGKQTQIDCNTCSCSADGTEQACTRMECPKIPAENLNADGTIKLPHEILQNPLLRTRRAQVCVPNAERIRDCNTCRCSPDGTAEICTRKICPINPRIGRDAPFSCTPNESFMMECNQCVCAADGQSAACTLKFCV